jgi:hypothetical protein
VWCVLFYIKFLQVYKRGKYDEQGIAFAEDQTRGITNPRKQK